VILIGWFGTLWLRFGRRPPCLVGASGAAVVVLVPALSDRSRVSPLWVAVA
jgi:hypothetical protein